jgi:hypothetical protein
VYVNPPSASNPVKMEILTAPNGDKFIMDKNGKRMLVKTDTNGN